MTCSRGEAIARSADEVAPTSSKRKTAGCRLASGTSGRWPSRNVGPPQCQLLKYARWSRTAHAVVDHFTLRCREVVPDPRRRCGPDHYRGVRARRGPMGTWIPSADLDPIARRGLPHDPEPAAD